MSCWHDAIPEVPSVPASVTVTGALYQPLAFGCRSGLAPVTAGLSLSILNWRCRVAPTGVPETTQDHPVPSPDHGPETSFLTELAGRVGKGSATSSPAPGQTRTNPWQLVRDHQHDLEGVGAAHFPRVRRR